MLHVDTVLEVLMISHWNHSYDDVNDATIEEEKHDFNLFSNILHTLSCYKLDLMYD